MITARASAEDIVTALDAGADDFIIKPIERSILLARVNAVLRRAYPSGATMRPETFGDHLFDPMAETVTYGEKTVKLTSKEFALALAFFRNMNRPLGRAYLLETVWGRNPDLPTRTLDAHVSRIRAKLDLPLVDDGEHARAPYGARARARRPRGAMLAISGVQFTAPAARRGEKCVRKKEMYIPCTFGRS